MYMTRTDERTADRTTRELEILLAVREAPNPQNALAAVLAMYPAAGWSEAGAAALNDLSRAVQEGRPLPLWPGDPARDLRTAVRSLATEDARTRLATDLRKMADAIEDADEGVDRAGVDALIARTLALPDPGLSGDRGPRVLDEDLDDLLAHLDRVAARMASGLPLGIPTGWAFPDRMLDGWQPGLHHLLAMPGAGKSTLAVQTARHAAGQGIPAIYLSWEESARQLELKAVAQAVHFSTVASSGRDGPALYEIRRGQVNDTIRAWRATAGNQAWRRHLIVWEQPRLSPAALALEVEHRQREAGADTALVIIDYLQKMVGWLKDPHEDLRTAVGRWCADLRAVALTTNAAVVCVVAENRAGQNSKDLRAGSESGDIEYSGDSLSLLTWDKPPGDALGTRNPEDPDPRDVVWKIAKNRYGIAEVQQPFIFRADLGVFREGDRA